MMSLPKPAAPAPGELPGSGAVSDDDLLRSGLDVVRTEADALTQLAAGLGAEFVAAVRLLDGAQGRVIVSGMGKSGHIGRKIAATLASTGTPAFFIHPAEACHGDLGMVVEGDVLLLLSNSGTTPELRTMMDHGRALGCKVIAIASKDDSPLMQAADIRLLLPPAEEACPVNLAPTTSTTLMLALGDALAIAVMQGRGLSRETIRSLHPGGSIGNRLSPVARIMHPASGLPLVPPSAPMAEVVIAITQRGFGIAGVVDDGELIGVITDGDLRRHVADLFSLSAGEVMTSVPKTVEEGTSCEDALALMEDHRITALFVTKDEQSRRPVGLVHIHDLARLHG